MDSAGPDTGDSHVARGIVDDREQRTLIVHGQTDLSREALETIIEKWDCVQIADPETGEVLYDGL